MPSIASFLGSILMLIGVLGYAYAHVQNNASFTALIPAAIGVLLVILGVAALRNEGPRRHLMHGATFVALLGFLASAGRLVMKASEATISAPFLAQLATAIVCLLFVILAVRSFIAARG